MVNHFIVNLMCGVIEIVLFTEVSGPGGPIKPGFTTPSPSATTQLPPPPPPPSTKPAGSPPATAPAKTTTAGKGVCPKPPPAYGPTTPGFTPASTPPPAQVPVKAPVRKITMCSELKQGREAIECLEQRGWQLYEGGQHLQVQHLIDIGTMLIACSQEVLDQLDSWGVWELPRDEAIEGLDRCLTALEEGTYDSHEGGWLRDEADQPQPGVLLLWPWTFLLRKLF
ncbi:uncharacterized protein LOC142350898 [Convolutriloba macropyga]|uniref:uncharacterized protein LOC142350898 n=1 Tax=Convolutriloba macropyga TaxID=536237 RepID=UPI003F527839